MKVIDMRIRPSIPEFRWYFEGPAPIFSKTGYPVPEVTELDAFMADVKDAGITKFVCTGRDMTSLGGPRVANEFISELEAKYPDTIIGVAGIDPLGGQKALDEITHSIKDLGLHGVSMDTFAYQKFPNDPAFYPAYEVCQELGAPIFTTMGPLPIGFGKMRYADPLYIDDVAQDFPRLRIVISHGGFPFTQEMISVAWRNTNIYFETSLYRNKPGTELLVKAGNDFLGDKMLYASAFPFASYRQQLKEFLALGYKDEVKEKILWKNAEAFLGMKLQ